MEHPDDPEDSEDKTPVARDRSDETEDDPQREGDGYTGKLYNHGSNPCAGRDCGEGMGSGFSINNIGHGNH